MLSLDLNTLRSALKMERVTSTQVGKESLIVFFTAFFFFGGALRGVACEWSCQRVWSSLSTQSSASRTPRSIVSILERTRR